MDRVARLASHGLPTAVLAAGLMIAAVLFPNIVAGQRPALIGPPDCPPLATSEIARAATAKVPRARERSVAEAVISRAGDLTGRQLTVASTALGEVTVSLPPESFVADPVGSLVVYTSYTPRQGSDVHAVDIQAGCSLLLLHSTDVVRSAVLDPGGTELYVHAVSAAERRDLGVSRHDLANGKAVLVVEPLEPAEPYGVTFSTELRWSTDAQALAVQSCGFALCRTRVLDVADGRVRTYAGDGHGPLIGLTGRTIYVLADSHARPAALLTIDRPSGTLSVVRDEVYDARIEQLDGAPRLLIETPAGTEEVQP
jgi:hypothetical protein